MTNHFDTAIFAGGCFWCMVQPFDTIPGIEKVVSGYSGGKIPNPTYEQVHTGKTGSVESVKITYDPDKISYRKLLNIYWQQTDPTDATGQFQDRGSNYQPIIYVNSKKQKVEAEKSKQKLQASDIFNDPIVTKIESVKPFYPAEKRHQHFYQKNPKTMKSQELGGRAQFKKKYWN